MRVFRRYRLLARLLLLAIWLHAPADTDISDSILDALQRIRGHHHRH